MKTNSKFTVAINKSVPKPVGSGEVGMGGFVFMSLVFIHNYITNSKHGRTEP